jgi:hypothetical protein
MRKTARIRNKASGTDKKEIPSNVKKTESPDSVQSSAGYILRLQKTIGNRATGKLLRSGAILAKLKIGKPGHNYEQEADRVADRIIGMTEPADLTKQRPEPSSLRQHTNNEGAVTEFVRPWISDNAASIKALQSELPFHSIRDNGRPLESDTRAYFEPRFGADFADVRIHTNREASETARAINARAYTIGRDIVFDKDEFQPENVTGKRLIAHELAHVMQHNSNESISGSTPTIRMAPKVTRMEPLMVTPSLKEIDERLSKHEEEINDRIDEWTKAGVVDFRLGIHDAAILFSDWYEQHPKKINSALFIATLSQSIIAAILAFIPGAGAASAIVSGLLRLTRYFLGQPSVYDPNAAPKAKVLELKDRMIALSNALGQLFADHAKYLKLKNPHVWDDIGIDLTSDPPLLEHAREELYTQGEAPRPDLPYTESLLKEMIYQFLDWEQNAELQNSTFFISPDSVNYAIDKEGMQKRFRKKADEDTKRMLPTIPKE